MRSEKYIVGESSKMRKGQRTSEEQKEKIRKKLLGHLVSQITRDKIRNSLLGNIPWNKGLKGCYSEKTLRAKSEAGKGRKAWNKGLTKETDKRILLISEAVKKQNKNRPDSVNKKISATLKRKYKTGEIISATVGTIRKGSNIIKNRAFCKNCNKEISGRGKTGLCITCFNRQKANALSKKYKGKKNPEHSKRMIKYYKEHPEKHPNYILAHKNHNLGKTHIEKVMEKALIKYNINYTYNKHAGSRWIDFGLDNKIGIECDGEFWHEDKNKDRMRDKELNKLGWIILHFTGKQIIRNVDSCVWKVINRHAQDLLIKEYS